MLAAVASLGLAAAGLSVAAAGDGPSTAAVSATFTVRPVPGTVSQRHCTGADGAPYLQVKETDSGPSTSPDPRLSGTLEVQIQDLLVNLHTGVGAATGIFSLRDPASGQLRASGHLAEALAGNALKGLLTGQLSDGSTLIANASGHVDFTTDTVTGEFGAANAAVTADLAVIRSGACP